MEAPLLLSLILLLLTGPSQQEDLPADAAIARPAVLAGANTASSLSTPEQPHDVGMDRVSRFGSPRPAAFRIWLYSLITVERGAAALLRHWLRHYLELGVPREGFLLLVNHNPADGNGSGQSGTVPQEGAGQEELQGVLAAFKERGINHRLWIGQYTCAVHQQLKLQILAEEVTDLGDWVLVAQPDEFQLYVTPKVRPFLEALDRRGQNWVEATLQDRASASRTLAEVVDAPSIFQQFRLHCASEGNASTIKVAAFRGYLRTDDGDFRIVGPAEAEGHFGAASASRAAEAGSCAGAEAYALTPYATHHPQYLREPSQLLQPGAERLWHPQRSDYRSLSQRFRWLGAGAAPQQLVAAAAAAGDGLLARAGSAGGGGAAPAGGLDSSRALSGLKCRPSSHDPSYSQGQGGGGTGMPEGDPKAFLVADVTVGAGERSAMPQLAEGDGEARELVMESWTELALPLA